MSKHSYDINDYWRLVKDHIIKNEEGKCWLTSYAPTKKAGYTQIRINGKKYYCHIIAASWKYKRFPSKNE